MLTSDEFTREQRATIGTLRLVFGEENVRVDPLDTLGGAYGYNGRGIIVWLGDWRKPTLGNMLINPDGEVVHISGSA